MKHPLALMAVVAMGFSLRIDAQSTSPAPPVPAAATMPAPPKPLFFHPPSDVSSGVLPLRVGGGSRGGAADRVSVETLVPDQEAFTTQAQPTLYWFQSKAAPTHCEITVAEPKNPKPLLSLISGSPTPAGIHELRISKTKVELKPGVVYRWSVAVVMDPANRSQDVIANGVIKRIAAPKDLAAKLDQTSEADKPALFAENGIWYDALQSISDEIAHSPNDANLRQEREDLLHQVGVDGGKMETKLTKSP